MLETEFVRSLQSNYERVLLSLNPDEQRYQYCIITRGGIRGLLPCSLRYINGQAYLYYDITSKQNVAQIYGRQVLGREWVRDFFWSYEQVRNELGRFLLDEENILVYPEQIFQDLSNHNFYFLYLPYNEEGIGMKQFLEFVLAHIDYDDEKLVECMYSVYEQFEKSEAVYLQEKIYRDVEQLEEYETCSEEDIQEDSDDRQGANRADIIESTAGKTYATKQSKKGFFSILTAKKKRFEAQKSYYKENILDVSKDCLVAENDAYEEEEYSRTIYVEQNPEETTAHKLYTPDGRVAVKFDKESLTIGKQKNEADILLNDDSVSRLHARIYTEEGVVYLEDLNSTNGTFKNGLRLQPYEKRRLEEGDEIRLGKLLFIYH